MAEPNIYTVGGTVQANERGLYISRRADEELLTLCRSGTFAYVLTPRQMGKSSLMIRTAEQLMEEGIQSVIIDLTQIGTQVTPEQWYKGLLTTIADQLMLNTEVDPWWQEQSHLGVTQRLTRFFERVVLVEVREQVVVFVDEIDTTLSLDFTDDFFAAIRSLCVARANQAEYRRLSFVLIGVATPGDLIRDPKRTPFNVGQRVELTDFTLEEVAPLAEGLGDAPEATNAVLQQVLHWTGGHPYLTQRLCRALADASAGGKAVDVKQVVQETFFGAMSEQDNNLQFVRDMLTKRAPENLEQEVLETYRQIRRGKQAVSDEEQSLVKAHLKLAGVVCREDTALRVRNAIYREVFNPQWIRKHLPESLWQRLKPAMPVIMGLSFIALVMGASALYADGQRQIADGQRQIAEGALNTALEQRKEAEKQRQEAIKERKNALKQTKIAQRERKNALMQRDIAQKQRKIALSQAKIAIQQRRKAENQQLIALQQRNFAEGQKKAANEAKGIAEKRQREAEGARQAESKQRNRAEQQTLIAEKRQRQAEVIASLVSAENSFVENPSIEAVVAGLKAGRAYQQLGKTDNNSHLQMITGLQQLVYGIHEWNRLEGHTDQVRSVSFSPDGKILASASRDQTIRIWQPDGKLLGILKGHKSQVNSVNFSPDGQTIASAGADRTIRLWSPDGKPFKTLEGHTGEVNWVGFSPDGKTLVSAGSDRTIKLWDVNGVPQKTLSGHSYAVTSLSFSPDNQILASASNDSTIKLWQQNGTLIKTLSGHSGRVISLDFSPNSQILASASDDGVIKFWNRQGKLLTTFTGGMGVSFSPRREMYPDSHILSFSFASANSNKTIQLWQIKSRGAGLSDPQISEPQLLTSLQGHQGAITNFNFSPDGQTLASTSDDKTIRLWQNPLERVNNKASTEVIRSQDRQSPDGNISASILGSTIQLLNRRGRLVRTLKGHTAAVKDVVFSSDSKTIVSGSVDGTVKIWSTDGQLVKNLTSNRRINTVAISPDGQIIASASEEDKAIRLWNREGKLLKSLPGYTKGINSLNFSSDGKILASVDDDKKQIFWSFDLDHLLERGCAWLASYFRSKAEIQSGKDGVCPF